MKNILLTFGLSVFLTFGLSAQKRLYVELGAPLLALDPRILTPPAPHSGWNVATVYDKYLLMQTLATVAFAGTTSQQAGAVAPRKVLIAQWFTPELMAQTIGGTFSGQFHWRTPSTVATIQGWVYLRLVNKNGTIAQEIGSTTTTDLLKNGAYTNRSFIPFTMPNVVVTGGQRILIEMGWNYSAGTVATTTAVVGYQNTRTATDLPVNNTETAALNPWFQFSQTLRLQVNNIFF